MAWRLKTLKSNKVCQLYDNFPSHNFLPTRPLIKLTKKVSVTYEKFLNISLKSNETAEQLRNYNHLLPLTKWGKKTKKIDRIYIVVNVCIIYSTNICINRLFLVNLKKKCQFKLIRWSDLKYKINISSERF